MESDVDESHQVLEEISYDGEDKESYSDESDINYDEQYTDSDSSDDDEDDISLYRFEDPIYNGESLTKSS